MGLVAVAGATIDASVFWFPTWNPAASGPRVAAVETPRLLRCRSSSEVCARRTRTWWMLFDCLTDFFLLETLKDFQQIGCLIFVETNTEVILQKRTSRKSQIFKNILLSYYAPFLAESWSHDLYSSFSEAQHFGPWRSLVLHSCNLVGRPKSLVL